MNFTSLEQLDKDQLILCIRDCLLELLGANGNSSSYGSELQVRIDNILNQLGIPKECLGVPRIIAYVQELLISTAVVEIELWGFPPGISYEKLLLRIRTKLGLAGYKVLWVESSQDNWQVPDDLDSLADISDEEAGELLHDILSDDELEF